LAVEPVVTVAVVEPDAAALGDRSNPLPERLAVCGLPVALSAIEIAAARAPDAPALNTTLIVQFAEAATLVPQLSVSVKSAAFAPVNVMPLTVSVVLLVLLSLMICAVLEVVITSSGNVNEVGESVAVGVPEAAPVPLSVAVCGLPLALSATLIEAVRPPLAVGLNVTLMVHVPDAATLVPHVLVCEKSPTFAPAIETLLTVSEVVLVFDSVML
jgi:hypothetical protein